MIRFIRATFGYFYVMNKLLLLLTTALLLTNCRAPLSGVPIAPASAATLFEGALTDYWYGGEAEITTYELKQARYGEYRQGTAVLIQVTEDFLTDKQVKNDNYENPHSTLVLKTNLLRRFTTGVYDYQVMSSVFTPTDDRMATLKVTTSAQDWCGQSFTQLNFDGRGTWRSELRSYFESEGDQDEKLPADMLEDELFNRIRIGGELPTGRYRIVPATAYLLLMHQPFLAAEADITEEEAGEDQRRYRVNYPALNRSLVISFAATAPYAIEEWSETYPSRGEMMTTTATVRERKMMPYWQLNANKDEPLRTELGLKK